ncbi:eukaryotic phosphomannomutase [Sporormia fimetaria CBS 119925]|uniref:Phosphomannomutase n=1 Tax=Sporormia fimetaria CBS 119925 TaxID=1340428 RepID=A0A6A6VFH9_9PLEO|nr:eukaryotic phosphomannomutase [Sporormia fimetaria CBS 119925]
MAAAGAVFPPLNKRPIKNTIVLFDVDNTLTIPRQGATPEMLQLLSELRHKVAIGFVGGSNLPKQQEQLGSSTVDVTTLFDFCFAENGLTAYRMGKKLKGNSFIEWIGEEKYKKLVNLYVESHHLPLAEPLGKDTASVNTNKSPSILHYIADLDIPIKRGTFLEFRSGMINVSPIGRNASNEERNAYEKYDKEHNIRTDFVQKLKERFADYGLTYSIGGQISFDVFPTGWDKTYCLQHIEAEKNRPDGVDYTTIHFFGDKAYPGGNDWEIYDDKRTIGHAVKDPHDTYQQLKKLFF